MSGSPKSFAGLLEALPLTPETELILRSDKKRGPTATLRVAGASPRIFASCAEKGACELLPEADDRLPGVALLRDPNELRRALGAFGRPTSRQLVAWRPGRRAVLRVGFRPGEALWIKLLDSKAFERACRVFDVVGAAPAPMRLCTPALRLPEHCAYVARPAPGVSLRDVLAGNGAPPLTLVGAALTALAFTPLGGALPRLDFETARAAAVGMLEKGAAVRPALADLARRVADMPTLTPPWPVGFVHGDLHDKQLFVAGGGVALIDLDGVGRGDCRLDVANLAEHLRLRDLQQQGAESGLAELLMVRANLDPAGEPARALRTVVRARLCGVYALRPRWSALVDRLQAEVTELATSRT